MKCQSCSNSATVHVTDIVNGEKRELHLCESCAEEKQVIKHKDLNLPAILQTLIGHHLGQLTDELSRLACPACGIKYMEFRAEGRLGCPNDYAVFRTGLGPLLERIHRACRHVGKAPKNWPSSTRHVELIELRRELRLAIDAEQYEEAARLRDVIRTKEAADEPG